MTTYAQLPSGIIAPHDLALQAMSEFLFSRGGYRSASGTSKNTAGWSVSAGSADMDTIPDLPTLRAQSSDLVRNDPLATGAINSNVTAVVGSGVIPQARVDYEFLGISEEEASAWQRVAERIFNNLAGGVHFDAERKQNFWQMQATVQRAKLERGDAFVLRRYIEHPRKKLGMAVQLVESDRVATPLNVASRANIRAGIEMDENGAATHYHVMQQHPGEEVTAVTRFTRLPAYDANGDPLVLPIIPRLRPGQTRGVPYLAPVIEPLKQLGRYTEAELSAAVISGMFAVFVKSSAPVSPLGPSIPGMVGGRQVVPPGNKLTRLQSGMIVDLAPGEEIQVADSQRPNTAFDAFVTAILRQIGMALEIPYEVLTKAYTASYSAARAAIIDAWLFFMKERAFLVETFCQPVWEWAISEAVARGELKAPGFFDDPLVRDAWVGCDWIGSSVPQIDPKKEADAATAWHSLGIWSKQDISNQQGRDYDRTYQQRVREKRMEDEAGLSAVVVQSGQQAAQVVDVEDDNDPEDTPDSNDGESDNNDGGSAQ